jgi:hypothetical protein
MAVDNAARLANAARLRVLHREARERVRLFSAHSPEELEAARRAARAAPGH